MGIGLFLDVDNTLTDGFIQQHYAVILGCEAEYRRLEDALQIRALSEFDFGGALIELFAAHGFTAEMAGSHFGAIPTHPWIEEILRLPVDHYLVSSGPSYYIDMLAKDHEIPASRVLCSRYGFDQQGRIATCRAVTDAQKAQFVQRHRDQHMLTVGVGDSPERDGPFLSQCSVPVLFAPGELRNANPNFFTMSSFGVLHSFLGNLCETSLYQSRKRPSVFVGSSREGKELAEALQSLLEDEVDITIWTQGVFEPSSTAIESLEQASRGFDFAVLVLTADDQVVHRGATYAVPRDNLIFELGLFTGALGRQRCLMVAPSGTIKLPSDLGGVGVAQYNDQRTDENWQAALQTAATSIRRRIRSLSPSMPQ
jgi:phosphoserine phosphatase